MGKMPIFSQWRALTTAARNGPVRPLGFVFDIDGVLLQSKTPIPNAAKTLSLLQDLRVPYALLTNGGGMTEAKRAQFLSSVLDYGGRSLVDEHHLVQSHTPLKTLANQYKRILLIGGPEPQAREVGLSYGFESVVRSIDLVRAAPNVWPFHRFTKMELADCALDPCVSNVGVGLSTHSEPIDAVVIINDPRDMGTELQVLLDLLNSKNGHFGTSRSTFSSVPSVPIIWSNNDFLWSTGFPLPRFGQGAFRIAVREIYKQMNNGHELVDDVWGKPHKIAFKYAESVLARDWKQSNGDEPAFENVYMVGDNPESDIKGGNDYGWNTILLRSGVYKDGDFDKRPNLARPSLGVYDNVWDGVNAALKKHHLI